MESDLLKQRQSELRRINKLIAERSAYYKSQEDLISRMIEIGNNELLQLTTKCDEEERLLAQLRAQRIAERRGLDDMMFNAVIIQSTCIAE